jgi:hypothetical protein
MEHGSTRINLEGSSEHLGAILGEPDVPFTQKGQKTTLGLSRLKLRILGGYAPW